MKKQAEAVGADPAYQNVLADVVQLVDSARRAAARRVNALMTATYWAIGRRIVEEEQRGAVRAEYAAEVVPRLSRDLSSRFGRGFGRANLFQMKAFYLAHPEIVQTLSGQSAARRGSRRVQSPIGQVPTQPTIEMVAASFPLPWSHYVRLLSVRNPNARRFYEEEALRGGWTTRQLDRQIGSQFYERTALSKNKAAMLAKRPASDPVAAEEEIKDPYVLEFLGLKDEYSETELEAALIEHLQAFLLELGSEFSFVGRQRRLRVGDQWFRIDLLLFHRRLRCLVVVDLKLAKFTHADAGQMHLYLNYAREHWTLPGENPPVGLILCAERNAEVARYALDGLGNTVLVAEYQRALPEERVLVQEMKKTWRRIEARGSQAP